MPRIVHCRVLFGVFAGLLACHGAGGGKPPTVEVKPEELAPGGVYIAHMVGCERGCDQLQRGDLIRELDGKPVSSWQALGADVLATGAPVDLTVHKRRTGEVRHVELVATPRDDLPPIEGAPPFWSVGAADLDQAPIWARRNLFGHASPMTMLVNADGGIIDGRQLVGKKHFILFWDWGTRVEQAQAATMMQVLQKARPDLDAAGVDIMFTQLRFPTNQRLKPMNDTDLRDFQTHYGLPGAPPLPMYRFPNRTEYNEQREVGLEGGSTYIQYLREPPAIVLLDEDGIVRWHSEGTETPPPGDPLAGKDDQWTVIQAIEFALKKL